MWLRTKILTVQTCYFPVVNTLTIYSPPETDNALEEGDKQYTEPGMMSQQGEVHFVSYDSCCKMSQYHCLFSIHICVHFGIFKDWLITVEEKRGSDYTF